MRLSILIPAAVVLPAVWGWCVHLLMQRIWPDSGAKGEGSDRRSPDDFPGTPVDYQI